MVTLKKVQLYGGNTPTAITDIRALEFDDKVVVCDWSEESSMVCDRLEHFHGDKVKKDIIEEDLSVYLESLPKSLPVEAPGEDEAEELIEKRDIKTVDELKRELE